jgi:hypothetical protein
MAGVGEGGGWEGIMQSYVAESGEQTATSLYARTSMKGDSLFRSFCLKCYVLFKLIKIQTFKILATSRFLTTGIIFFMQQRIRDNPFFLPSLSPIYYAEKLRHISAPTPPSSLLIAICAYTYK